MKKLFANVDVNKKNNVEENNMQCNRKLIWY